MYAFNHKSVDMNSTFCIRSFLPFSYSSIYYNITSLFQWYSFFLWCKFHVSAWVKHTARLQRHTHIHKLAQKYSPKKRKKNKVNKILDLCRKHIHIYESIRTKETSTFDEIQFSSFFRLPNVSTSKITSSSSSKERER